jgi:hypothetical protein
MTIVAGTPQVWSCSLAWRGHVHKEIEESRKEKLEKYIEVFACVAAFFFLAEAILGCRSSALLGIEVEQMKKGNLVLQTNVDSLTGEMIQLAHQYDLTTNALAEAKSRLASVKPLPEGIAVDGATNIYVTDSFNDTIRKITPVGTNWVVSTIGGLSESPGSADGVGSTARFYFPQGIGIAVDNLGTVYVADTANNTIRKGVFTACSPANAAVNVAGGNGTLSVTLLPAAAGGQWRFGWEQNWRAGGTTAGNLVPGNYPVQFKSVPGWLTDRRITRHANRSCKSLAIGNRARCGAACGCKSFDPFKDRRARRSARGERLSMDQAAFEGAPEAFHPIIPKK